MLEFRKISDEEKLTAFKGLLKGARPRTRSPVSCAYNFAYHNSIPD